MQYSLLCVSALEPLAQTPAVLVSFWLVFACVPQSPLALHAGLGLPFCHACDHAGTLAPRWAQLLP